MSEALRKAIAYYKTEYPGDGSVHWHEHFVTVFAAAEAMLVQPRLPDADHMRGDAVHAMGLAAPLVTIGELKAIVRALYAHLRAAGDDNQHGQTGVTQASVIASTPVESPELRTALSTLRGWSAEAAGRSGLKDSILLVCNAAESTLPVTLYRIRARGLDAVHEGPVSISEVPK